MLQGSARNNRDVRGLAGVDVLRDPFALSVFEMRADDRQPDGAGIYMMMAYMHALGLADRVQERNDFLSIYDEFASLDVADENVEIRAWGARQGMSHSQIDAIIADPDQRMIALGATRMERGSYDAAPLQLTPDQIQDRQRVVASHIEEAAAVAGVSSDLMRGMWGVESAFGTHRTLVSSTGCSGDWQFSRGTFAAVIRAHADEIPVDHLTEEQRSVFEGFVAGRIRASDPAFQQLRFDPIVSTYAAAFYMREVADTVGVDPMAQDNFGVIYAGYNVGPGNAARMVRMAESGDMRSARAVLGEVARLNPMFFVGGVNAEGALGNYQGILERRIADYRANGLEDLEGGVQPSRSFARAADVPGRQLAAAEPRPPEQRNLFEQAADTVGGWLRNGITLG